MTASFLYGLFYLGVLALVVSCLAYLLTDRGHKEAGRAGDKLQPPSREVARRAEQLSGSYRLADLERVLEQLGAMQAWGMVLELGFKSDPDGIQMIVGRNEVELCAPRLDASYTDHFRRAAKEAGFEARAGYTEGQYCVDVTGTWSRIARTIRDICKSIYGVGDGEEVQVHIFN